MSIGIIIVNTASGLEGHTKCSGWLIISKSLDSIGQGLPTTATQNSNVDITINLL